MRQEALPAKRSRECDKLISNLMEHVNKTRELAKSIKEGKKVINDIRLLENEGHEMPFPEGEGNAVQAYEDHLDLAGDQLQMLIEEFQTKLAELPDDVRKKLEKKLSVQEMDRLYGNNDGGEPINDSVDDNLIDDDRIVVPEHGHEASANA